MTIYLVLTEKRAEAATMAGTHVQQYMRTCMIIILELMAWRHCLIAPDVIITEKDQPTSCFDYSILIHYSDPHTQSDAHTPGCLAERSVLSDTWWARTGGALLSCTTHTLPSPRSLPLQPACPFPSSPERLTRFV